MKDCGNDIHGTVDDITMITAKMTVIMVTSSPDNDEREYGVFGGGGCDDDNGGDKNKMM